MSKLNPFPLGRVVGSPEVIDENAELRNFGIDVGEPMEPSLLPEDSSVAEFDAPKVVGGFSITSAESGITRIDPRMLDRFESKKAAEHKASVLAYFATRG